ncbi:hypothetical protein [Deinococcus hopiensis]|uniref:Uncharacterized protein n=1 Tax=Deinococcus hopiensis KR-140 TaxID=695939 RepID=A0A1W1UUS7_9DEIO|nr:hypothetical protein [Deinococcus hopiensis]SMB84571.1 hypothetical protein SAMN00790413_05195 [Deinococcus hopiensis KR-140]
MTGFQNFTEQLTPRLVLGFFTALQRSVHVYKYGAVRQADEAYTLGLSAAPRRGRLVG